MSSRPVLYAAAVVLSSACAAAPQVDTAAEEQAVRAVSQQWLQAETARDAAAIAALFTDDGIVYREDREPVSGSTAIQAYMAQDFADDPQETASWTTDRVDVAASGDLAVEHGTWTSTGGKNGPDNGWYLTQYRKANDQWKVVADMSISTRPAAAPAAPAN
jgi:uncharacterized protein (TIGR02246 family)